MTAPKRPREEFPDEPAKKAKTETMEAESLAETRVAPEPQNVDIAKVKVETNQGAEVEEERHDGEEDEAGGELPTLKLLNLKSYANKASIEKLLKRAGAEYHRIKKAPKWTHCFVRFKTVEQAAYAKGHLQGIEFDGKRIDVQEVEDVKPNIRTPKVDHRPAEERLADQVTPYWRLTYPEQLAKKHDIIGGVMKGFGTRLRNFFPKERVRGEYEQMQKEEELAELALALQNKNEPQQMETPPDVTVNEEGAAKNVQEAVPKAGSGNAGPPKSYKEKRDEKRRMDLISWKRAQQDLPWLLSALKKNRGLPCPLESPIPSPVTEGYRTKVEFGIGKDLEGNITVGFMLGLFEDGIVNVLAPQGCRNVSPAALKLAASMQHFLREVTHFPIYDRVTKTGFWRSLMVRTPSTGEVMAHIQYNPTDVDPSQVEAEIQELSKYFQKGVADGHIQLTTLLVQDYPGAFNGLVATLPSRVVFGEGVVKEKLLGLTFRISHTAFFQVNAPATEILYSLTRDWCALDSVVKEVAAEVAEKQKEINEGNAEAQTLGAPKDDPGVILFDLCCGTGTIGLCMASKVKKVVGIEMDEGAVNDARANAEANGITNVVYINGKIEDVISDAIRDHVGPNDQVVAVLDPPRTGTYYGVIGTIRKCEKIQRVVYISCAPEAALNNFVE
ncbi:tRNA methyltransferase 2 [Borealophlyctis nickersoniae]|nr:tRNA methyltransferase 2 [Borealophlyctis nickersoniae]